MFIDTFNSLCLQRGISANKAAKDLELSHSVIGKWKAGARPQNRTLMKVAEYFNVPVESLLSETDEPIAESYQNAAPAESPANETKLPVYGSISAGRGVLAVEDIIGWAYADEEYHDGNHFWLSVSGVSMEPELRNGDLVLIRKQSQLDNGNIGAFIYGGEGFVKKYIANGDIRLHSLNPVFPDIVITPETADQFSVIGKVIEARHKY